MMPLLVLKGYRLCDSDYDIGCNTKPSIIEASGGGLHKNVENTVIELQLKRPKDATYG